MTTPDPAATAEAATDVVQAAAKPIGFLAALAAGALAVAWLVKRFGQSLPPVGYPLFVAAGAEDDEDDEDGDDD